MTTPYNEHFIHLCRKGSLEELKLFIVTCEDCYDIDEILGISFRTACIKERSDILSCLIDNYGNKLIQNFILDTQNDVQRKRSLYRCFNIACQNESIDILNVLIDNYEELLYKVVHLPNLFDDIANNSTLSSHYLIVTRMIDFFEEENGFIKCIWNTCNIDFIKFTLGMIKNKPKSISFYDIKFYEFPEVTKYYIEYYKDTISFERHFQNACNNPLVFDNDMMNHLFLQYGVTINSLQNTPNKYHIDELDYYFKMSYEAANVFVYILEKYVNFIKKYPKFNKKYDFCKIFRAKLQIYGHSKNPKNEQIVELLTNNFKEDIIEQGFYDEMLVEYKYAWPLLSVSNIKMIKHIKKNYPGIINEKNLCAAIQHMINVEFFTKPYYKSYKKTLRYIKKIYGLTYFPTKIKLKVAMNDDYIFEFINDYREIIDMDSLVEIYHDRLTSDNIELIEYIVDLFPEIISKIDIYETTLSNLEIAKFVVSRYSKFKEKKYIGFNDDFILGHFLLFNEYEAEMCENLKICFYFYENIQNSISIDEIVSKISSKTHNFSSDYYQYKFFKMLYYHQISKLKIMDPYKENIFCYAYKKGNIKILQSVIENFDNVFSPFYMGSRFNVSECKWKRGNYVMCHVNPLYNYCESSNFLQNYFGKNIFYCNCDYVVINIDLLPQQDYNYQNAKNFMLWYEDNNCTDKKPRKLRENLKVFKNEDDVQFLIIRLKYHKTFQQIYQEYKEIMTKKRVN